MTQTARTHPAVSQDGCTHKGAPLEQRITIERTRNVADKKTALNRKRRLRTAKNAKLRDDNAGESNAFSGKVRKSQAERYALEHVDIVKFDALTLPSAQGAWIGKVHRREGPTKTLQEYLKDGYTLHEWDGR